VIDHDLDINVHSKILLINANVGGATSKKIVFMGSLNMVEESLKYNDDTFLQISNDTVYQDYLSYIEHIRKNVLPGSATPLFVTYPQTSYRFFSGVAIQPQQPVISAGGLAARCTVTPALPAGLKLSTSTCAISGTPSTATGKSSHSITVKSEYASHQEKTVVISIDVPTSYIAPPKPCTGGFCQQLP
ncbi:MAG: putative Ig domain-containing protein, partial [Bdellovibrionales bacterium]|nr:putative Ig domain-containing protein [Bdellovibrionales bacterium]